MKNDCHSFQLGNEDKTSCVKRWPAGLFNFVHLQQRKITEKNKNLPVQVQYANKRKIIQNIGSLQRFAKTQRLYMASKSIILTLIGLSINDQKIKFFESNETCKRAVPTIPFWYQCDQICRNFVTSTNLKSLWQFFEGIFSIWKKINLRWQ